VRFGLLGKQAVHGGPARGLVGESTQAAPGPPPVRSDLTEVQFVAGPLDQSEDPLDVV
jgi:hypothetical protein